MYVSLFRAWQKGTPLTIEESHRLANQAHRVRTVFDLVALEVDSDQMRRGVDCGNKHVSICTVCNAKCRL